MRVCEAQLHQAYQHCFISHAITNKRPAFKIFNGKLKKSSSFIWAVYPVYPVYAIYPVRTVKDTTNVCAAHLHQAYEVCFISSAIKNVPLRGLMGTTYIHFMSLWCHCINYTGPWLCEDENHSPAFVALSVDKVSLQGNCD